MFWNFVTKNECFQHSGKGKTSLRKLTIASFLIIVFYASCVFAASPVSLIKNGDFEEGDIFPDGWRVPEQDSVHFIQADPFHGRVLEIDTTDVPTTGVVFYRSPLVEIEEGREFLFEADIKTLGVDLTVSIVGMGDVCGERRPVYRAISLFKADQGNWRNVSRTFCPSCRNYKVRSLQIIFSAPGNPGRIYLDNILLAPVRKSLGDLTEKLDYKPSSETEPPIG